MYPRIRAMSLRQRGFTLVELAIVLLILTILFAALTIPLRGRLEAMRRQQTADMLEDIQAALTGFAIIHRRLPCPTTVQDPAAASYGLEEIVGGQCAGSQEGMLPWRTLGLPAFDVWGSPRTHQADPWSGFWRYRVDGNYARPGTTITTTTSPGDAIGVVDRNGHDLTATGQEAVALIYSTGPDLQPNGQNASFESASNSRYEHGEPTTTFDDMVVWIGRPLLLARMAQAGAL